MGGPGHRYPLQQLAHGGDFIGFGLDQLAAAIILTGRVGERDDLGALCVTQLLAICGEQLPRRRRRPRTCLCQSSNAASTGSGSTACKAPVQKWLCSGKDNERFWDRAAPPGRAVAPG